MAFRHRTPSAGGNGSFRPTASGSRRRGSARCWSNEVTSAGPACAGVTPRIVRRLQYHCWCYPQFTAGDIMAPVMFGGFRRDGSGHGRGRGDWRNASLTRVEPRLWETFSASPIGATARGRRSSPARTCCPRIGPRERGAEESQIPGSWEQIHRPAPPPAPSTKTGAEVAPTR